MTTWQNRWFDIQDIQLRGKPRIHFLVACSVVGLMGVLTNLPIIIANIIHRFRHSKKSDYYSTPQPDRRGSSQLVRASVVARRSGVLTEEDRRSPYFSAVSMQAKYKYSHVVLALSIFNFLSCIIQIPSLALVMCFDITPDISNQFAFLTLLWNVFQIMFMCTFQFINTSIQFLSICFPLHFSLRRSPLFTAFFIIIAVCLATSVSEIHAMEDELFEILFNDGWIDELPENKSSQEARAIAIRIPFLVYCLTAFLTLVMYGFIMRSIHNSKSFVRRSSLPSSHSSDQRTSGSIVRQSILKFWNSVVRQNIQSLIMLGTSTLAIYLLELPYILVFCGVLEPHYCVLISHLAVHTVQPVLHITLSKAFREVFKELFMKADRNSTSSLDTTRQGA